MSFKDVLMPIMQSEEAAENHFRQHLCIRRAPPGEESVLIQVLINIFLRATLTKTNIWTLNSFSACPNCGRLMTYVKVSTRNTSRAWRCPSHKGGLCKNLNQVLNGS